MPMARRAIALISMSGFYAGAFDHAFCPLNLLRTASGQEKTSSLKVIEVNLGPVLTVDRQSASQWRPVYPAIEAPRFLLLLIPGILLT